MSADNPLNQGWEFGSDPLENRCGSIPNFLLRKRGSGGTEERKRKPLGHAGNRCLCCHLPPMLSLEGRLI